MQLLPTFLRIGLVFLVSCTSSPTAQIPSKPINSTTFPDISPQEIKLDETFKIATVQTIYVPIYSEIYYFDKSKTLQLAATLSVRNTDSQHPIIITSVKYWKSDVVLCHCIVITVLGHSLA